MKLSEIIAEEYAILHEKPIWQEATENPRKEIYRFLSLPSFENSVLVRIDVGEDGRKVATVKKSIGSRGPERGKLDVSNTIEVSDVDFAIFTNLLHEAKFWDLPSTMPAEILAVDGSSEIMEVVKNGKYHVVDWSSPNNGPYFLACIHLQRLGFPESLYPPLSFFYQQHNDAALRIDEGTLDNIKNWKTEGQTLKALGPPHSEEADTGGKNAFYRLRDNGCLAIRYDKNGARKGALQWSEYLFIDRKVLPPSTVSESPVLIGDERTGTLKTPTP